MASVECIIEPWAEKALRLLRSEDEDSVDQLRLMLEESIRQKYGSKKSLKHIGGPSTSTEKEGTPPKKSSKKMSDSDSSSSSFDSDIIAIMDQHSCKVCKSTESEPDNQLVDCAECHKSFHQECHNPPITDINDPRVVWYCSSCSKTVAKPKPTSGNGSSPSSSSSSKSSTKASSSRSNVPFSNKAFPSTSGTSSRKSGSSASSSPAPSTSKGSSSSSKNVPKINIINADKRLQIMKKKAAKKQEKRGISK